MDDTPTNAVAALLALAGIEATPLRLLVAEVLDQAGGALAAADILTRVRRRHDLNKVTLYRTLDLFVERGLVLRHSSGDRAFRYCLGGKRSGAAHCHAYCRLCGRMQCVSATGIASRLDGIPQDLLADVENVEIRLDGVCERCRKAMTVRHVDATRGNL